MLPAGPAWSDPSGGAEPNLTVVAEAGPRMLELINRERVDAGLTGLALDGETTEIAARWSRRMALAGRISHNKDYLSQESMERLDAVMVGENVAFADSIDRIHSMLMNSPPHRANILKKEFRLVGVAAVRTDTGDLYLTEDFLTRSETPPPDARTAAPKPAPENRQPVRPAPARQSRPAPARPRPAPARKAQAMPPKAPRSVPVPATGTSATTAPVAPPAETPVAITAPVAAGEPAAVAVPNPPASQPEAPLDPVEAQPGLPSGEGGPPEPAEHQRRGTGGGSTQLLKGLSTLALLGLRRSGAG
ncbi:MAG TPA: CAP domain-containing protein [Acidimicrobiia bacterium]|nr:CAP domain-containing protein [Acidimicrobiia bacterium]